ncbi:hypothetical protein ABFV83_12425 [Lacrimispora sp. BS-2]|uniref:DUF4163 domain-containing protein n=1 Tax=Lacrimispora sp. BS-2 TaxID=3151850 RepID=A0AAU7PJY0_9FIRM
MKGLYLFFAFLAVFSISSCKSVIPPTVSQTALVENTEYQDEYIKLEKCKYVANEGKIQIYYPQLRGLNDSSYEKIVNDALYIYALNDYFDNWTISNLSLQVDYSIHYMDKNYISIEFTGKGDTDGSRVSYVQYGVNLDLHQIDYLPNLYRIGISDIVDIQSLYDAISNGSYKYIGIIEDESDTYSGEDFAQMFQTSLKNQQYNNKELTNFFFDEDGIILLIDDRYPHKLKVAFNSIKSNLGLEKMK